MARGTRITTQYVWNARYGIDKGKGSVRAHPDGRADITYHFDEEDVQRIKDGLVAVSKILLAGGATDLRSYPWC